jgi:hypothetical protein
MNSGMNIHVSKHISEHKNWRCALSYNSRNSQSILFLGNTIQVIKRTEPASGLVFHHLVLQLSFARCRTLATHRHDILKSSRFSAVPEKDSTFFCNSQWPSMLAETMTLATSTRHAPSSNLEWDIYQNRSVSSWFSWFLVLNVGIITQNRLQPFPTTF